MSSSLPRELVSKGSEWRELQDALLAAGWTPIGRTADLHLKYRAPAGFTGHHPFLTLPSTPGRGRGIRNARARMKRAGIHIPSRGRQR